MAARLPDIIARQAATSGLWVAIVKPQVTEALAMAEIGYILDQGWIVRTGSVLERRTHRITRQTRTGL